MPIPKTPTYIDEAKQTEIKTPIINLSPLGDAFNSVGELTTSLAQKTQQIETANKLNDFSAEYQDLTKQFKKDYSLNPENKNLMKDYQTKVKDLQSSYDRQIPSFYRTQFNNDSNALVRNQNIDLWTKGADFEFQVKKYQDGLDNDILAMKDIGLSNDEQSFLQAAGNMDLKLKEAPNLFGNHTAEILTRETKRKATVSYLSGLLRDNPQSVIAALDNPVYQGLIDNKNSIAELKDQAKARQNKMSEWNREQNVARAATERFAIMKEIYAGVAAYDDILLYADKNSLDNEELSYLLKKAGYDGAMLFKGGKDEKQQSTATRRLLDKKLTPEEKAKTRTEIYAKLMSLLTDGEATPQQIQDLQIEIEQANLNGSVSNGDSEVYMDWLQPKLNSILATKTRDEYTDNGGWNHFSIGYPQLKDKIETALKTAGLPTELSDKTKITRDSRRLFYDIQNAYYENYMRFVAEEMNLEADANNIPKTTAINDLLGADFYIRQRVYKNALDKTIQAIAQGRGIDTKNKTIQEVQSELKTLEEKAVEQRLIQVVDESRPLGTL
jgi:hypothetical protein